MPKLNVHIAFNGNCEEAFNFYKTIFGGDFSMVSRNKEIPEGVPSPATPEEAEKILHISLPIGEHSELMGCDMPKSFGMADQPNSYNVSINAENEAQVEKYYNALSEGGRINMPLDKTFWGQYFGMVVDKYGVQWMLSCDIKQG